MAAGNVVSFAATGRRFKARRYRSRLREGVWLPALIVAGAAAIYGHVDGTAAVYGNVGGGTAPRSASIAERADFALCARGNQQTCVIDGDTIRYGGVKIRLADIDAPEAFSPKCASEAALAERATQRLVEVMNAGPFELVRAGRDEDIYGRKLRLVERGGRSVADTLVAEGLARRWDGARRSWCG
jgi:endonuclease YncB( thermonuclease family)